jgi:hypothetical protein
MPEPDEISQKAMEIYNYMARWPIPDQPLPLEFIFKLVGLPLGTDQSRKIWDRILLRLEIESDYRKRKEGSPVESNGRPHNSGSSI